MRGVDQTYTITGASESITSQKPPQVVPTYGWHGMISAQIPLYLNIIGDFRTSELLEQCFLSCTISANKQFLSSKLESRSTLVFWTLTRGQ